ncbi:hypothetical protein EXIGLDRAFT_834973 [Exidia glandulosa HHB12029]|uniref:Uncharacterized protein n=1 Tax=Exidia glandulosa HHB12029 TaxID=1314781 RepID=A0A165J7J7_EXIGL|nr:hypothetical protein EXIGLDRAFT_834973 [Exidia glandulosa HHB12029]
MSALEHVFRPLYKRQLSGTVRFASSAGPAAHSTASLPHYTLARSRSRSRARSSSRPRSVDSDSDDDAGYETAAESPPMSSSPEPSRGRTTSPARSRTPDSSHGPATPVSTVPLACVTSADILRLLHHDASSPVPFPYRLQWPELPPSPPLTPDFSDASSASPDRPLSSLPPITAKRDGKDGHWKRSTWATAPAPGTRKVSNVVAWTSPSPSFEITPSRVIPREIPRPDAEHEASGRKGHSRTHSEPVKIGVEISPVSDDENPSRTNPYSSPPKHVHRKLQKKKRVSAPPVPAPAPVAFPSTSAASTTPASTLVGTTATQQQRPKRVSALSLFGAHHQPKGSALLTPPATPTAPQIVVTGPSLAAEPADPIQEPTPRQRAKTSRFGSLFGVPFNAPISLPKATPAAQEPKDKRKEKEKENLDVDVALRTTARDGERSNSKLWPVNGSANASTMSVPLTSSTPKAETSMGMGWGRASTLSLTLLMGSGSAARSTRRLQKARGVTRSRDPENEEEEDVGTGFGGRLARVWSGRRKRAHVSPSTEDPIVTAHAVDDDSDVESEYGDAVDLTLDSVQVPLPADDIIDDSPNPVFDVVKALRRQSADGLMSSSASTSSAASGTLLFRPLKPKTGSMRSCSPSPSLILRGAFVQSNHSSATLYV